MNRCVLAVSVETGEEVSSLNQWNVAARIKRRTLVSGRGYFDRFESVACSPDGRFIAAGGRNLSDGRVTVWTSAGAPWAELPKHSGPIWSLAFSPDSQTLAVGDGTAGVVRLWDVQTGQARERLDAFRGAIFGLAFAPDGRTLAAGGTDGQNGSLARWTRSPAATVPE